MKRFLNELLYFTHALFLTIFLFAGYEMIFIHGNPVDIIFGIIVGGYPLYVITKSMKTYADFHIDNAYSFIKIMKEKHNIT